MILKFRIRHLPAENKTVAVNPPAFSWVLEKGEADFKKPVTIGNLPWAVYTHNAPIAPDDTINVRRGERHWLIKRH